MSTGTKANLKAERVQDSAPLLLRAKQVADLLNIGESTLWRHHSSGRIPKPVRIGRSIRWRAAEIRDWVEAGCPPRERWEQQVKQGK